jgi:DNA-binding response OmpR family regulator
MSREYRFLLIGNLCSEPWQEMLEEALVSLGTLQTVKEVDAFKLAQQNDYEAIIIDAVEVENVPRLVSDIRSQRPKSKIIIVTASPVWERAREVFQAGATDYIFKSMNKRQILSALHTTMEKKPSHESANSSKENNSMKKMIVLLADNNSEFLDMMSEALEQADFEVLKATSPEEAERILRDHWVHLAIIDVRLRRDNDEKDISGLMLAKKEAYRSIPKIILTAWPQWAHIPDMMKHVFEGLPSAVDYLEKGKDQEITIQAVKDAFAKYVRINWNLEIRLKTKNSFVHIVSLIEPHINNDSLLDRAGELEDLFRKLFYDNTQITIGQLITREDGWVILKVFAHKDRGTQEQFVISCGRRERIKEEERRFEEFAPQGIGAGSTSKINTEETMRFAAIIYRLNDADMEATITFGEFWNRPTQEVLAALDHLYDTVLPRWHKKAPYYPQESMSLSDFYLDQLKLSQEELERRVEALCRELTNAGLTRLKYSSNELILPLSNGSPATYRNPIPYLFGKRVDVGSPVPYGSTPGQLNGTSVLVNPQARTWLINFSQATDKTPLLHDFVSMETAIKFELFTIPNIQARLEMEKRLLAVSSLAEEVDVKDLEPEVQKMLQTISHIRKRALAIIDHQEMHPYLTGLLFCAVGQLATYNSQESHLRHELISYMHSLLSAAMICKELTPSIWIDVSNGKVGFKHKELRLNEQEFNLLWCLCEWRERFPNSPCSYQAIAHRVFKGEDYMAKIHKNSIFALVRRLREKIEPNPENPEYIVLFWNKGYKLEIDCKFLPD